MLLFSINSLLLLLLAKLGRLLFFFVNSLGTFHFLQHGCPLLFKFLGLVSFPLLVQALLLLILSRLYFIEGTIPVDCILIVQLLLVGVLHHSERRRVVGVDSLKAVLLNKLPCQLLLVFLRHFVILSFDIFRGFDEGLKGATQLGVLENVDASCKRNTVAMVKRLGPLLHCEMYSIDVGTDGCLRHH